MSPPPSLLHPDLAPVWSEISTRLARNGLDWRGRVRIEPVPGAADLALASLLGRRRGRQIDLAVLEAALARVGAGDDLVSALDALGAPVATDRLERRASRQSAAESRDAFRAGAAAWSEPWVAGWTEDVLRAGLLAGLTAADIEQLLAEVRGVLDLARLSRATGTVRSRTEIAALAAGDAHALDVGRRLRALVERAIACEFGDADGAWDRAGLAPDTTSAPALVWGLAGLHPLLDAAGDASIPAHLSVFALRARPVAAPSAASVLVVENPRLVEAAAQRDHPRPMVCANGNPSAAVRLLLQQLRGGGARLLYHGDFDAAGLAMCDRMRGLGAEPWHMDAVDYHAALAEADQAGVALPVDESPAPPTPWDPALQVAFDEDRRIVHEERLVNQMLAAYLAER